MVSVVVPRWLGRERESETGDGAKPGGKGEGENESRNLKFFFKHKISKIEKRNAPKIRGNQEHLTVVKCRSYNSQRSWKVPPPEDMDVIYKPLTLTPIHTKRVYLATKQEGVQVRTSPARQIYQSHQQSKSNQHLSVQQQEGPRTANLNTNSQKHLLSDVFE